MQYEFWSSRERLIGWFHSVVAIGIGRVRPRSEYTLGIRWGGLKSLVPLPSSDVCLRWHNRPGGEV